MSRDFSEFGFVGRVACKACVMPISFSMVPMILFIRWAPVNDDDGHEDGHHERKRNPGVSTLTVDRAEGTVPRLDSHRGWY